MHHEERGEEEGQSEGCGGGGRARVWKARVKEEEGPGCGGGGRARVWKARAKGEGGVGEGVWGGGRASLRVWGRGEGQLGCGGEGRTRVSGLSTSEPRIVCEPDTLFQMDHKGQGVGEGEGLGERGLGGARLSSKISATVRHGPSTYLPAPLFCLKKFLPFHLSSLSHTVDLL